MENKVKFQWHSLKGSRPKYKLPAVAVVGKNMGAQFCFENESGKTLERLEIAVIADPVCEYEISECSTDIFNKDYTYQSRFMGLYRQKTSTKKIICDLSKAGNHEKITGWMRVKIKNLGSLPISQAPGVQVNFVFLTMTLRAEYKFEGNPSTYHKELQAQEVTFMHRGNIPQRIAKKWREAWIEFMVIGVVGWILGTITPKLLEIITLMWETILNSAG